jgi:signal transduction histidine kinase
MRARALALFVVGLAAGLAAEWAGDLEGAGAAADLAVGLVLVACGAVAWNWHPESRVGALMSIAGFSWFLGTVFEPALYLHRGPLVHLVLAFPTGHLKSRVVRVVAAAAYVDAAIEPLAQDDVLTLALCAVLALTAGQMFRGRAGPARRAGAPALAAALALAGVLALGSILRLAGFDDDALLLLLYELVIVGVTVGLLIDLMRGRWAEAVVTGLVVELGPPREAGTLRGVLARALGDPSLVVGYPLAGTDAWVDDAGEQLELPTTGADRTVTPIDHDGARVAVLVHDAGLLADPKLLVSVAAAARLAVANARLQAEARMRAAEVEASRRRIVESADAQRRRLEQELRAGAERRLENVAAALADAHHGPGADGEAIQALETELGEARDELREFAQGVHPAALAEGGLMPAVTLLAKRSPIPVDVRGHVGRLPASVEAALYFVCSEGLANAVKHAGASSIVVGVRAQRDNVVLTVSDDGVGGAAAGPGSGLRNLTDRVEALGGRLALESPPGAGTRVVAELPLDPRAA